MAIKKNVTVNIDGILVGGYTDRKITSGITVFTIERPNVAGIFQSGGSPASFETDILRSTHRPDYSIDAMVFTGRSVYGFKVIPEIMKILAAKGKGVILRNKIIPIIPSMAIFDLRDNFSMPDESWAIESINSLGKTIPIGNEWGGTGATVGKYDINDIGQISGQGYYEIQNGELTIGVYVIANSIGHVYDLDGKNISSPDREDLSRLYEKKEKDTGFLMERSISSNTTIGAVITNAILDNREASYLAQIANFGFASRVFPYSSGYDGDTVFCVSTLKVKSSLDKIAYLTRIAAEKAIISIFK